MVRTVSSPVKLVSIFLLVCVSAVSGTVSKPNRATGSEKCGMCHRSRQIGNQYDRWKSGPHTKAFRTLQTEGARKLARQQGVEHPEGDMACLKCHTTAGFLALDDVNGPFVVEGVGCEACHGAGSRYSELSVMQDRKKAIMKGLNPGSLKDCLKCHNGECPAARSMDPVAGWNRIAH